MGYTAQVSGVIDAKFGCHGILGNPVHFPFFAEEKIRVDVDLIDDSSCLHGAISIFNAENGPSKIQPLRGPCPSRVTLVQASAVIGARFVCHCILGSPMLFVIFSHENNISVDADLIGETSCLHGAIPFFMMEK